MTFQNKLDEAAVDVTPANIPRFVQTEVRVYVETNTYPARTQ